MSTRCEQSGRKEKRPQHVANDDGTIRMAATTTTPFKFDLCVSPTWLSHLASEVPCSTKLNIINVSSIVYVVVSACVCVCVFVGEMTMEGHGCLIGRLPTGGCSGVNEKQNKNRRHTMEKEIR